MIVRIGFNQKYFEGWVKVFGGLIGMKKFVVGGRSFVKKFMIVKKVLKKFIKKKVVKKK